jgi:hypothetical protein
LGINHPVAEVQLVAVVTASLREYQSLITSLDAGATIQAIPPDIQIVFPPSDCGSPNGNLLSRCHLDGPNITAIFLFDFFKSIYNLFLLISQYPEIFLFSLHLQYSI